MSVIDAQKRILIGRRRRIEPEWAQIQADADHWNRLHPDQPPIVIEPITREEIERLRAERHP